MTKHSYKYILSKMLGGQPSGLSYAKIISNFKQQYPNQCRKVFIRRALAKAPFKLSRNKYVLSKKKKTQKKKKVVSAQTSSPAVVVASSSPAVAVVSATIAASPPATTVSVAPQRLFSIGSVAAGFSALGRNFGLVTGATVFDNSTVVAPIVSTAAGNAIPQWQYEHDGWKNYDKTASDVVETAYQEWKQNPYTDVRAIKSGEWQYMVDFNAMMQENIQHDNHTRRKIRRELVRSQ